MSLAGFEFPRPRERVRWIRLGSGSGRDSSDAVGELEGGVGGGVDPGWYSLIEHQFLLGNSRLLFLDFPSTSCVNIGIMSSSVYMS